jgi:hypothetical protein
MSHDSAKDQTIPLPYYIDSNLNDKDDLIALENQCLDVIQLRIVGAKFSGKPFLGLLMETMLSGCGGELSHNFYKKLAAILQKNNIKVIMDEIMTGGRVGPGFASSLSLPAEFISQIRFITMGKIFDCGLLLEAVTNQPTWHILSTRGFSTTIEPGYAKAVWTRVCEKIQEGQLVDRREQVVKALNIQEEPDEGVWGKGLLVFTKYRRNGEMQNLRSRLNPRIDLKKVSIGKKMIPVKPQTRNSLTKELMGITIEWIKYITDEHKMAMDFQFQIAKVLLKHPQAELTRDTMVDFVGNKKTGKLEKYGHEKALKAGIRQTKKTARSFFVRPSQPYINLMMVLVEFLRGKESTQSVVSVTHSKMILLLGSILVSNPYQHHILITMIHQKQVQQSHTHNTQETETLQHIQ